MEDSQADWFAGVPEVVADPDKFKSKLAIGEDAYTTLRVKNAVSQAWDTLSAAASAAALAKSSIIAAGFVKGGVLTMIGVGTAATPVGWVVGAALLAGGASIGITQYLHAYTKDRVKDIPEFINTPYDVIGLALFDLMAPLVLKVAHVDGAFDQREMERIEQWFVREWGYDPTFVQKGMAFFETCLDEVQITDIATALARYKRESPDCNYRSMSQEVRFLREVMEADGVIDEREELVIEEIARIFEDEGQMLLVRGAKELVAKLQGTYRQDAEDFRAGTTRKNDIAANQPTFRRLSLARHRIAYRVIRKPLPA